MTTRSTATQPAVNPKLPRSSKNNNIAVIGVAIILALGAIVYSFTMQGGSKSRAPLNDQEITFFLRDPGDPDSTVYALQQIQARMAAKQNVSQWYPDLIKLTASRNDGVQHAVADIMGADPRPDFHDALLALLRGNTLLVRNAAAIALAQYNDSAGREQILSMLHPEPVTSPGPGRIDDIVSVGRYLIHGEVLAKLNNGGAITEIRSPATGTVKSVLVGPGDAISAGIDVAVVEPGSVQVIAALRALGRVGYSEDVEVIAAFASDKAPPEVREAAKATQSAIRTRAQR